MGGRATLTVLSIQATGFGVLSASQEALNKHRLQAARVGIAIRPQTFSKPDRGAEEVAEEQSSTASPDQKADLTPLKRMYVRTEKGVRGVFEICLAPGMI